MNENAANVQRKHLKDLQKAWKTIAKYHFLKNDKSGFLKAKEK